MNAQQEYWRAELSRHFPRIPEHMRDPITRYVLFGAGTGRFLRNMLENRFIEAIGQADDENLASIRDWTYLIRNALPLNSYGSIDTVNGWLDRGGLSIPSVPQ